MLNKDFLITKENKALLAYKGNDIHVSIPNGVTKIAAKAFARSRKIVKISVPNTVTEIGNSAFEKCTNLMSVTLPNSVQKLGIGLFNGCINLISFTFSESVTEIPDYAFSGCRKIDKIEIPESIKKIGKSAFEDCNNLKSVIMISAIPSDICENAFPKSVESIAVPGEALDSYRDAWAEYKDIIVENLSLAFKLQKN